MRKDGGWEVGKKVEFPFILNLAAVLKKQNSASVNVVNVLTNKQTAHFLFYCTNKLVQLALM
jgi:hypothetical protein